MVSIVRIKDLDRFSVPLDIKFNGVISDHRKWIRQRSSKKVHGPTVNIVLVTILGGMGGIWWGERLRQLPEGERFIDRNGPPQEWIPISALLISSREPVILRPLLPSKGSSFPIGNGLALQSNILLAFSSAIEMLEPSNCWNFSNHNSL